MQTLSDIRALLQIHGLAPNRSLGQNFLVDHNLLRRLVDRARATIGPLDGATVLEIGPGTGTLTGVLIEEGARVVACELDGGMARLLRKELAVPIAEGRVTLIEGDCLEGKHALNRSMVTALGEGLFALVANLPYGAASPVMANLACDRRCVGQFVTVQKEVGQRLRADPGSKDFGELGVLVQSMCEVERVATLAPTCFWPRPKVTSEMVAITPRAEPLTDDPAALAALCRRVFSSRRKQIGTTLGRDWPLPEGVDGRMRPEALSVEQLVAIARSGGATA